MSKNRMKTILNGNGNGKASNEFFPAAPIFNFPTYFGVVYLWQLKHTTNNPPERLDLKNKANRDLRNSILRSGGPIAPLIVRGNPEQEYFELEDANRRTMAALTVFGPHHRVNCILVDCPFKDLLWVELSINGGPKNIASASKLWLYSIGEYSKLNKSEVTKYANMEAVIGQDMIKLLVENRLGYSAYERVKRIGNICSCSDTNFFRKATIWMCTYRKSNEFEQFIRFVNRGGSVDIDKIYRAIMENKAVQLNQTKKNGKMDVQINIINS